jgi:hypothetical protein
MRSVRTRLIGAARPLMVIDGSLRFFIARAAHARRLGSFQPWKGGSSAVLHSAE